MMDPTKAFWRGSAATILLLLAGASSLAAETLYVYANRQLHQVDPDRFEVAGIGPVDPNGPQIHSLTPGPDGDFYGVGFSPAPAGDLELFRIDADDGTPTRLGDTGVSLGGIGTPSPPGLAFDGHGQLWLVVGHQLYAVDAENGVATATATLDRHVIALAENEGRLYAVTWVDLVFDHRLEILDPEAGTLETVLEFYNEHYILDADFDSRGHLRYVEWSGGLLAYVFLTYYELDPTGGPPSMTSFRMLPFQDPLAFFRNLGGAPQRFSVEVPVLRPAAAILLSALLLAAGLLTLRRP